jgi:glycosyltransferase involved in cell wall biosynthesis
MPRILRIINRLNLGGPTFNVSYLTKYMAPEYETMLVSGMKDESEESSEFIVNDLGLTPVYIPEMRREINFIQDRIAYQKIKKLIQEFKPDIVHTHAAKAGAIGRLAAKSCKVPIIIHTFHGHVFHSYFSPSKTKIYVEIEKYLAKTSTCIIAISESQKIELSKTFNICTPEKIEIVKLGFDLLKFQENQPEKRTSFRARYNIDADEIVIGIVGRLVPVKNHFFFLEVLKAVFTITTKKVRAFIIGDGELREKIAQYAKELGLDSVDANMENRKAQLTFTSWIKEVDFVYAGLDIVALTSLNEGTPVSLIEAQAANKPVVSTRVGGVENIVLHNHTGLLSENGGKETFVKNIVQLIENEEFRKALSQGGWRHVKEQFHYERLVKEMRLLYDRLLADK